MSAHWLKKLEKHGKQLVRGMLLMVLPATSPTVPPLAEVRKILVFRLDERIGNGILLLPLLRAMRRSRPDIALHLLIHHPVAHLLAKTGGSLLTRIWPYDQARLMRNPFRYLNLLRRLRRERYDLVFTSHNPDYFSLSQAIFGRLIGPRRLVGFDWRDNRRFYDIAVPSATDRHYADAMIDLWRAFDPAAKMEFGGLSVSSDLAEGLRRLADLPSGGILLWLGATKDKVLPADAIAGLRSVLADYSDLPVHFAAGPADRAHLHHYPPEIREQTVIWEQPLTDTAAFFVRFALFVSADTGPMHLAVALGIPTISVFLQSNFRQYGYQQGCHATVHWPDADAGQREFLRALRQVLPVSGAGEAS